jgi:hypothetical protein
VDFLSTLFDLFWGLVQVMANCVILFWGLAFSIVLAALGMIFLIWLRR